MSAKTDRQGKLLKDVFKHLCDFINACNDAGVDLVELERKTRRQKRKRPVRARLGKR